MKIIYTIKGEVIRYYDFSFELYETLAKEDLTVGVRELTQKQYDKIKEKINV